MSELTTAFNWSGYGRWLEPPDLHELCACRACHAAGDHLDKPEQWAYDCDDCEEVLARANRFN